MATYEFGMDLVLRPVAHTPSSAKATPVAFEEMLDTLLAWNMLLIGRDLWGEAVHYLCGNRSRWWDTIDLVGVGGSGTLYALETKKKTPSARDTEKFVRDAHALSDVEDVEGYFSPRYAHNRGWMEWNERRKFAAFHLGIREQIQKETLDLPRRAIKRLGIPPAELESLVKRGAGHLFVRPPTLDEFLRDRVGTTVEAMAGQLHRGVLVSPRVNRVRLAEAGRRIDNHGGRLKLAVEYVSVELLRDKARSYLKVGPPERAVAG